MFELNDKVIVLIGGAGMLGVEFSKAILAQGGRLYSLDLEPNAYTGELKENKNYIFKIVNAKDKPALEEVRDEIIAKEGHIDVLINSATSKADDAYFPFEKVSLDGWDTIIMGNLTISFIACQVFVPQMQRQKWGSIINISSIYGMVGNDQSIYEGSNLSEAYLGKKSREEIYSPASYNAAKGGLIAFTKFLAAYYGKDNVRINCISPGGVDSGKENKTFLEKYSAKVPLGRKAKPDEINGAVVFLSSDASSYITGHNLVVDGGYTIW